jgi:hypothetical protein
MTQRSTNRLFASFSSEKEAKKLCIPALRFEDMGTPEA